MTRPTAPLVALHHGDALDVLRTMADASIDAIVTDPPYGLAEHKPATITAALTAWCSGDRDHVPDGRGFMGRAWDAFVPPPAVWDECLRVLRPGGHLLCFAGSRTVDLMGLSVRLAGFEIRDTITWHHGEGFPKGKAQLKPASEPIIVARKRAPGPWLNIDGCRVAHSDDLSRYERSATSGFKAGGVYGDGQPALTPASTAGRWPANVVFSHAPCCGEECAPGCPVAELDAQSGTTKSVRSVRVQPGGVIGNGNTHKTFIATSPNVGGFDDSGTASRFFPTFKYQAKAPARERPKVDGVSHPTVKPLALMRWLVRLVTPPGGTVLDPFAGSGTTLQATRDEGFASIGIEREASFLPLIAHRLGAELVDLLGEAIPVEEPAPVDPILAAIEAAEPHRPTLVALWREHEAVWTDVHTAAVKARLT